MRAKRAMKRLWPWTTKQSNWYCVPRSFNLSGGRRRMTDPWTGEPKLAELRRAYHLIECKDPGAIPMLENLVSVGSVMAMVYLGTAFQKGLNGRPDRVEAE